MTNSESDFIDTPQQSNLPIKEINRHLSTAKIETDRWMTKDDEGRTHPFDIPGTYLVSELPIKLVSPKHAAREIFKKDNQPDSMVCTTFADRVSLTWCRGKYKMTVPLRSINIPIVRTNPGYNNSLNATSTNPWSTKAIKAYKHSTPRNTNYMTHIPAYLNSKCN
jgi:hypothetical protein